MISDPNSNIFTKSMSQLWHTASQLWHHVTIVTRLEILVLYVFIFFLTSKSHHCCGNFIHYKWYNFTNNRFLLHPLWHPSSLLILNLCKIILIHSLNFLTTSKNIGDQWRSFSNAMLMPVIFLKFRHLGNNNKYK